MKSKKIISLILIFAFMFALFAGYNHNQTACADSGNKKYVIDIVWDGISSALFDKLKADGLQTPNIDSLISNGTRLKNVKTTIPSYGAAQAALLTGAYPETNGFLYRYLDKSSDTVVSNPSSTYKMNGQTIFESINSNNPSIKTLVSGYSVASLSIDGRGVSKTDPDHKLNEYAVGDKLVSFYAGSNPVGNDILTSINNAPDGMQDYILAYSNDVKMLYWNGGAGDPTITEQQVANVVAQLDAKLGEIINALKEKGIYDDTIIILNSLSSVYTTKTKIDGSQMAADIIKNTGVPVEFNGGGTVQTTSCAAVIIKTYIMKYAQLYFTDNATDEQKADVLGYLNNKETTYGKFIKQIYTPDQFHAPNAFADYLLDPIDEATFCAAGSGSFRTDNLDDLDQFCVVSGKGVIRNAEVPSANIVDIAPTISALLGINPPANNEGKVWEIFDLNSPQLNVVLTGQKNVDGLYESPVSVNINAQDDKQIAQLQYDIGNGFTDYTGPFTIDTNCTLTVRAVDDAGNVIQSVSDIQFIKLINNIQIIGDIDSVNGNYYTDANSITISGSINPEIDGVAVTINDTTAAVKSGEFSGQVDLKDGINVIQVKAILNGIGNVVEKTVYKVFNPTITSISNGAVVSDSLLDVNGKTIPGALVKVNDRDANVDENGNFSAQVNLTEGENSIAVIASVGKYSKETDLKVNYYSPVNIEVTNLTDGQIVKTANFIVKGKVDKPCSLSVNGTEAVVDQDGAFSAVVALTKGINTINIKAVYNGVEATKTVKVDYVDPNDKYVVYINWDGFARYYYDLANQGVETKTPVINSLIKDGVFFDNAYTGIPSITNAMQPAIVSGAWPATTGNAYRYYDKKTNTVIQFNRENNAETIAEAAVRQGLKVASVNQFALQDRGTVIGDPSKPYIQVDGDYAARFDAAIKLIRGEPVGSGASQVQLEEIPRFIALYMDDLDGIGHNEEGAYGVPVASTEAERLKNVIDRLELMDTKLGEFINACKERGIYDNMVFVLTTDHGMAPYGQQGTTPDDYTYSKLPDLLNTVNGLGYKTEVLFGGQQPKPDTDIVVVCVGLEAQLSFTKAFTGQDIDKIINAVKDKPYVGQIMTKDEMGKRGALEGFADLLISPKAPYHFKTDYQKAYVARGQHDSLDDHAQHIFSIMWGNGVKKGYVYEDRMYNIDFARTMAKLLGIDGPKDATGQILTGALEDSASTVQPGGSGTGIPSSPPSDIQPVDDAKVDQAIERSKDSGQVIIDEPSDKPAIALMPTQLQKIKDIGKPLTVVVQGVKLVLPPEVIADMANMTAAQIEFKAAPLAQEEARQMMDQASNSSGLRMTQAFEFKIEAVASNGTRQEISQFNDTVTVVIPVPEAAKRLASLGRMAVYNYNEGNKTWEPIGGSYDQGTNTIAFETEHFSKYALLEKALIRLGGADRFETSVKAARQYYPKADIAILAANANDFADGVAASVLAGAIKAPVLLTQKGYIPQSVSNYLKEAGVKTVYIMGGPDVVAPAVEKALSGYKVERVYGDNREGTAVEITKKVKALGKTLKDTAIIVNGYAPADALAAGPVAAQGMPLLMVNKNNIPKVTKDALKEFGIKNIIIVGDTGVVSDNVLDQLKGLVSGNVERAGGRDRIATSVALANKLGLPNIVVVGYNGLPDAVAGGYIGALEEGAVIYSKADKLNDVSDEYIKSILKGDTRATILGDNGVVSRVIEDGLVGKLKEAEK